ncbi:hypothetical protein C8F01DRAFT_1216753 [Mycena amicta]|nr:hypothetical protein C8F01DRAFT_1216753 [Mycena amicta]
MASFGPVNPTCTPSQFGFGFGLGASSAPTPWQSNPMPQFHQPSTSLNQSPVKLKRRLEEDDVPADHFMDRSPTPERPRRAAPKRARVATESGSKDDRDGKENKAPNTSEENEVDVGVLLASLPSQSLLPLLTALLSAQPSLKATVLSLIPRPTLEIALQALSASARRLRDAYPYSTNLPPTFTGGFPRAPSQPPPMRDSYVSSRLRTHVADFATACISYLPYFSLVTPTASSGTAATIHKAQLHPSETYSFLAALTGHMLSLPPLAQTQLAPQLLSRLNDEWKAWLDKVDVFLNQQGGMFAADIVRSWERELDQFAGAAGEVGEMMRPLRDSWIAKVGWTVGRQISMDI